MKEEKTQLLATSKDEDYTSSIVCSLLKSVFPYSIANLIYYGGIFGTTTIMSRLEPNNPRLLAATGLMATTEIFGLHTIWASEFSSGVIISELSTEEQYDEIGGIFLQTLIYGTTVAAPIAVLFCFTGSIYPLLGQTHDIASLVQKFTRPFAVGAIPFVWLGALEQFTLSTNHRRIVIALALTYVGTYLPISYFLTYGKIGLPKYGIAGVAIARSISSWFTAINFLAYIILNKKEYGKYNLFDKSHWRRSNAFKAISKMGAHIAIQVGSELAGLYILSLMAGSMGDSELGAYQVNLQYLNILVIIPVTIGQCTAIEIGNYLGEANDVKARRVGNIGIILSFVLPTLATIGATAVVISPTVRNFALLPFVDTHSKNNQLLLRIASWNLLINTISQVADSLRNTSAGALRGYKDTAASMVVSVVNMGALTTGLGFLFANVFDMETEGLFTGRGIAMILGSLYLLNRWMRRLFENPNSFESRVYNIGKNSYSSISNWCSSCTFFRPKNKRIETIDVTNVHIQSSLGYN